MSVRKGGREIGVVAGVDFVEPFVDVIKIVLMEENLESSR